MRRDVEGRELQGEGRTPISPPVEGTLGGEAGGA